MGKISPFARAYAVIMAGGSGTRFWPLSRRKRPKQLLELFGRESLLEQTVARIRPVIPSDRIYVFTNELVRDEIARRVRAIPKEQIVAEPVGRNTAPTIGLAAHEILWRDPDALMVVLPSDHVIARPAAFRRVLRAGCRVASVEGRSVIVGFKPTRPETGYGYVRRGAPAFHLDGHRIFKVEKFTEKPPLEVARRYLASGRYLWNGGMFIWRAATLISNLEQFQPRMTQLLNRIVRAGGVRDPRTLRRLFPRFEKISIDYALMEKISNLFVVPADVGWSDVGSWEVAYELRPKDTDRNVRPRESLCLDAQGNMIFSREKFVVTLGTRDLVIVETSDALLVCARERSQEVGKAVEELERRGMRNLL